MQQEEFLPAVSELKARGKSIRAIAEELGVNRGRVDRALKKLALSATEKLATQADKSPVGDGTDREVFVGRNHEVELLTIALADALTSGLEFTDCRFELHLKHGIQVLLAA